MRRKVRIRKGTGLAGLIEGFSMTWLMLMSSIFGFSLVASYLFLQYLKVDVSPLALAGATWMLVGAYGMYDMFMEYKENRK